MSSLNEVFKIKNLESFAIAENLGGLKNEFW